MIILITWEIENQPNSREYIGRCKWWSIQDKNNVHGLSELCAIKRIPSILIENNLIEYLDGAHKFKTTEKGLNYLKFITKWQNC